MFCVSTVYYIEKKLLSCAKQEAWIILVECLDVIDSGMEKRTILSWGKQWGLKLRT